MFWTFRHSEICTLLLENNSSVSQQNNYEVSPEFAAAYNDHVNVSTLLLENNVHIIKKIMMVYLHCLQQRTAVIFMYAPYYLITTHMSINKLTMKYRNCREQCKQSCWCMHPVPWEQRACQSASYWWYICCA